MSQKPVQFYLEEKDKTDFEIICKKLSINKSEFFRNKVRELIASNADLLEGGNTNENT